MNSKALQPDNPARPDIQHLSLGVSVWRAYVPIVSALLGPVLLVVFRLFAGGENFISDGALMMLALWLSTCLRRFSI